MLYNYLPLGDICVNVNEQFFQPSKPYVIVLSLHSFILLQGWGIENSHLAAEVDSCFKEHFSNIVSVSQYKENFPYAEWLWVTLIWFFLVKCNNGFIQIIVIFNSGYHVAITFYNSQCSTKINKEQEKAKNKTWIKMIFSHHYVLSQTCDF